MAEQAHGTLKVKTGFAEMMKGGVIMDVVNPEQAKIAEDAGAVAVMALERVPADIRAHGGVARMSDPTMIEGIVEAVSIPVMAKCRIGHFVEAQVLQSLGVDFIDESEVLTPADDEYHVNKWDFDVPFVCGARNLGEALRRIAEGAAMIRTKGEPGTGNVVEAVRHMRTVTTDIARIKGLRDEQLFTAAKDLQAPYELVKWVAEHGCLPVVNFSAGGIGNFCGIGFESITLLCPLGALLAMIAERTAIPMAVISVAVVLLVCIVLGKVFCAWACPVHFMSRGRKKTCY